MANPIKTKASVLALESLGDRVYGVMFKAHSPFPHFKPGQFLHLTLDEYDPTTAFWPESRVFSIAFSPTPDTLGIYYSVRGTYTARLERELSPGRSVWLKLPYGNFIIEANTGRGRDVVLVAGGTGLSPFIVFLDAWAATLEPEIAVSLLYGMRRYSLLLAKSILRRCLGWPERFHLDFFLETMEDTEKGDWSGAVFHPGVISVATALERAAVLLSGPPGFLAAFREGLAANGVPRERVIMDNWE
jgi:NAD(P)H-flavin reductase